MPSYIIKNQPHPQIAKLLDPTCDANADLNCEPINLKQLSISVKSVATTRRAICLPEELVVREARVTSQAKHEWAKAHVKKTIFHIFEPHLQNVIDLNIEKAKCFGYPEAGEPWDALAEGFQAGCTAAYVEGVFHRHSVSNLLHSSKKLKTLPNRPTAAFNEIKLPD